MSKELQLHNTMENFLETILTLSDGTLSLLTSKENQNLLFWDLWNLGCDFFTLIRIYAKAKKINEELGKTIADKIPLEMDNMRSVSLNKLSSLIPHWTGTKYVLQDIQNKVLNLQVGVYLYNSNLNIRNPRAYNDIYILIVTERKSIFIDVNRRKINEIRSDVRYNNITG